MEKGFLQRQQKLTNGTEVMSAVAVSLGYSNYMAFLRVEPHDLASFSLLSFPILFSNLLNACLLQEGRTLLS